MESVASLGLSVLSVQDGLVGLRLVLFGRRRSRLGCFGSTGGSRLRALGGLICAGSCFGRLTRGRFGVYGRLLGGGGSGDSAGSN